MSRALDQLQRLLALLPELAEDREYPIDEVADRLGLDRGTLIDDLRALTDRQGLPGGFVETVSVWHDDQVMSVHASHFLRPMRLTRQELLAVELGLAMLRTERPVEEQRAVEGARERLRGAVARLPGESLADSDHHAETGAPVAAELLEAARRAARDRRKVRLRYQKALDPAPAERVTCPYAVVFANGMWYVVGHCEDAEGLRVFRADRIQGVEVGAERFEVPGDFSIAAVIGGGRAFAADGVGTLTVRYSERIAAWIAEREGGAPADDGTLTVEYPLADPDWAVRHVLQYGPDAEIVEPAEARAAIRKRLAAMRRAVAG